MKAALLLSVLCFACGNISPKSPTSTTDLPRAFADAFQVDALGDASDAVKRHLGVVRDAARADGDPWQLFALEASLEALATRKMPSLGDVAATDAALAYRTREPILPELVRIAGEARGAFARGLIARAVMSLEERAGDAAQSESWRTATGCAREALVIGPTTWAPVTGVAEQGPLDGSNVRIEPSYATDEAFGRVARPRVVSGRGCAIALSAESSRPGVREVVVDVDVPRAQTIGLALRAHGAAILRAGGALVVVRPFELGDGEAARFARVSATAGTLRLVARVGTAKESDSVEIDAWSEDGAPLHASAPAIGSLASARALRSSAQPVASDGLSSLRTASSRRDEETLLESAAAMATGSAREAERLLWADATRPQAPPALGLVYGRAVETARDLSVATRAERARGAYGRVLEAWKTSWEATIAHAVLAGTRRGRDEGGIETLRDLDAQRATGSQAKAPLLDAFDALVSGRQRLFDRASKAIERAHDALSGTALYSDALDASTPRVGAELVAASCDPARTATRDSLDCFDALRATGDHDHALAELARVRTVLGGPKLFLSLELRERLLAREVRYAEDAGAARPAFEAMLPAERTLTELAELFAQDEPRELRSELLHLASTAADAPSSIAPLLRASGDDPAREFDGVAERLAVRDHESAILPSAATAILAHVERYDVSAAGLLRWVLFDVRRVSGTTDVEENAQAVPPDVWGRATMRVLRRRILKSDGRVLEPESTPRASQAHADLSQLEQGDIVEAVYEGWSLPGDAGGDIGVDTPDLLPDRAAVHDATIEIRLPRAPHPAIWSHPLLGKAAERADGDARVLTWHVTDLPVRRVEGGVPKMDRSAAVSFSTAQWGGVARALRETIATLDEHDPEMASWARAAAGPERKPTRAMVSAVVVAAGKALREADSGILSDYGGGIAPVQSRTARTFLTSHEGSRSWLIARSLRELGVPCEIVVAENDPYSGDPSFPAHFGRFLHPLVVAHVEGQPLWIDADVRGPPLPAGHVSPELRGRLALRSDGTVDTLPSFASFASFASLGSLASFGGGEERDEVDVRLALDERGNARGTFAIVLRGHDAQELSEALLRTVGAERQHAFRDVVLAWLPWANVDDVHLASSEGSWQVSLRAAVDVSGYAQLEGRKTWLLPGLDALHWSSPRARVSSLGATFATRAGRESALALSTAVQYHVHRRIDLPAGAVVARIPGPLELRAQLVEASRKIGVSPAAIEDDFVLGVATGTIPTKDYEAFVSVAHAVDDAFLASTRVTLP